MEHRRSVDQGLQSLSLCGFCLSKTVVKFPTPVSTVAFGCPADIVVMLGLLEQVSPAHTPGDKVAPLGPGGPWDAGMLEPLLAPVQSRQGTARHSLGADWTGLHVFIENEEGWGAYNTCKLGSSNTGDLGGSDGYVCQTPPRQGSVWAPGSDTAWLPE